MANECYDSHYRLVTLEEAKDRLSIDFNERDEEILGRINAIVGYLTYATGIREAEYASLDAEMQSLAREYVLSRLYYDYYDAQSELNEKRLTGMVKQLQYLALYYEQ